MDSFRFDFRSDSSRLRRRTLTYHEVIRGNFESPGAWRMGGFEDDFADISAAVAYLTSQFGYVIDLVIGHSRGSVAAMRWVCCSKEGQGVRGFVNASGRYRMRVSAVPFL